MLLAKQPANWRQRLRLQHAFFLADGLRWHLGRGDCWVSECSRAWMHGARPKAAGSARSHGQHWERLRRDAGCGMRLCWWARARLASWVFGLPAGTSGTPGTPGMGQVHRRQALAAGEVVSIAGSRDDGARGWHARTPHPRRASADFEGSRCVDTLIARLAERTSTGSSPTTSSSSTTTTTRPRTAHTAPPPLLSAPAAPVSCIESTRRTCEAAASSSIPRHTTPCRPPRAC